MTIDHAVAVATHTFLADVMVGRTRPAQAAIAAADRVLRGTVADAGQWSPKEVNIFEAALNMIAKHGRLPAA